MGTGWAALLSVALLAGNGFFVAAEFALVASKRYRLEQAATDGGRAAHAALDASRELTLMLAGAQLGITLCSLGLGALAEPALERVLSPLLHAIGLPDVPSHVVAFAVALLVVTFLHLVVGEMVPKSWAITDPERSAALLARPFRAFTRVVRPGLRVLNALANALLRPFGVRAQDQVEQSHGPEEMDVLLERSQAEGTIEAEQSELLASMLRLQRTTVGDLLVADAELVQVPADAPADRIEAMSVRSGRSRLAVVAAAAEQAAGEQVAGETAVGEQVAGDRADEGRIVGIVHVREAVRATTAGRAATAADLMDPPFTLDAGVTVTAAVTAMRDHRAQLAIVTRDGGRIGFVALEDLLEQIIGEFDDETDLVPAGRRMR